MEITSDIPIDRTKIFAPVLEKVEQVELAENSVAKLDFKVINGNIWMLNISYGTKDGKSVLFRSLNLYQEESRDLVFNMQDGKVDGFVCQENYFNAYREFPDKPEDLISEILFDLFVHSWD